MTATLTRRYHHPVDLICPAHRAVDPMPAGGIRTLLLQCGDCEATWQALREPNGDCWTRLFRDFTPAQREANVAHHEAAHAVVGMLMSGNIPTAIGIEDPTRPPSTDPDGWVVWDGWFEVSDGMAMSWAGLEASLRWLSQEGLDTQANRFDAHLGALGDVERNYRDAAANGLRPTTGRSSARYLVGTEWPAVSQLARALLVYRELTGEEARQVAGYRPW